MDQEALRRARPDGLRVVGAAGLRHADRGVRALRREGPPLYSGVGLLLRPVAVARRARDDRRMVPVAARVPEGDLVEHALRRARPRVRERTAHGAVLSAGGGLPLLAAPGDDEAP